MWKYAHSMWKYLLNFTSVLCTILSFVQNTTFCIVDNFYESILSTGTWNIGSKSPLIFKVVNLPSSIVSLVVYEPWNVCPFDFDVYCNSHCFAVLASIHYCAVSICIILLWQEKKNTHWTNSTWINLLCHYLFT